MKLLTLRSKDKLGCNKCDKCCVNRGDIRLTGVNIYQISKYLSISPKEFISKYTHDLDFPEIALKAVGEKQECILYTHEIPGCSVHMVKPMQCVMFPLVPVNLSKDLFYNQGTCVWEDAPKTSVKKWLNGNNGIYKKFKNVYIDWIYIIEYVQMFKFLLKDDDKSQIKFYLFENYDLENKNIKKQVYANLYKVKDLIDEKRKEKNL